MENIIFFIFRHIFRLISNYIFKFSKDKVIKKPSQANSVSMTEKKPEKSDNSQSKQSSNVSISQSNTPKKTSSSNSNTMSANVNKYKVNFEYFKNFSLINETPVEENDSGDQIYKYSISSHHKLRKSIFSQIHIICFKIF